MTTAPGATDNAKSSAPPLGDVKVLELYFLKARAAALDIAAMLDRLSRAEEFSGVHADDRRDRLQAVLRILTDSEGDKARRVQETLSVKG